MATEQFTFLLNRFVRFKVSDVTVPGPQEVVTDYMDATLYKGRSSKSLRAGRKKRAFIIVKVEGMNDFLILPAEKVIGITDQ